MTGDGLLPPSAAGEHGSGDQRHRGQPDGGVPGVRPPERGHADPRHAQDRQPTDVGRVGVPAVLGLVGVAAGDQPALRVEGDQPVQQQPAGHLWVLDQHDLARAQFGRGHRLGDHDVPRLDPGGHGAAGDDVRGVAQREREERGQDETGQHGQREDDGHARRRERPAHGRLRASQVKVAVDRVPCARLLSSTR